MRAATGSGTETAAADVRSIERRILDVFDGLTEGERRLAQVVREMQGGVSGFTAGELAAQAGVSAATAVRFFRRLGYRTFGEVRRQARDRSAWASPATERVEKAPGPAGSGFADHAAHDCRNLVRTAAATPPAALDAAIGLLARASRVHVLGFRNSMALATYARAVLLTILPEVQLLPQAGMTLAEDLAGLGQGQVMLAVGFRRRPPALRDAIAAARDAGTEVVLIADDSAAGIARLATVTLRCESLGFGMFDSYAAAVSVINFVANGVGLARGAAAAERLDRIEALHGRLGSFGAAAVRRPDR